MDGLGAIDMEVNVVPGTTPVKVDGPGDLCFHYIRTVTGQNCEIRNSQPGVTEKYRQIFNSPETSFGQPFLGNVLKVESVVFGGGKAHFVQVKNNAKCRLTWTEEAQRDALNSSRALGETTNPFDPTAMFTAYQAHLAI
jgi:hypothetical protein